MAKITMIAAAITMFVVVFAPHANGITCQSVDSALTPCITFLKDGGAIPKDCCNGVRSLNSAANTAAARRMACECIKVAAKDYNVNPQYAAMVPKKCNVNIGYAISYNTNCNNVH